MRDFKSELTAVAAGLAKTLETSRSTRSNGANELDRSPTRRIVPWPLRWINWFGIVFPKLLETIEVVPEIAEAASVWLEGGDVARQVSDQMRWLRRHSPSRNRLVLYHDIARREIRRIRHGV